VATVTVLAASPNLIPPSKINVYSRALSVLVLPNPESLHCHLSKITATCGPIMAKQNFTHSYVYSCIFCNISCIFLGRTFSEISTNAAEKYATGQQYLSSCRGGGTANFQARLSTHSSTSLSQHMYNAAESCPLEQFRTTAIYAWASFNVIFSGRRQGGVRICNAGSKTCSLCQNLRHYSEEF
jgi:hypothetical protein